MRLILLLLLALQGAPALGQPAAPVQPAPTQAAPHAGLSPREAQDALAVLRDEKRRGELMSTLDAIAKAGAASAPTTQTPTAPTSATPTSATPTPGAPTSATRLRPDFGRSDASCRHADHSDSGRGDHPGRCRTSRSHRAG